MTWNELLTLIGVWLGCGIAGAGFFVATLRGEFPSSGSIEYRKDLGMGLVLGMCFGPVWLITGIFMSGFGQYGWSLRPPKAGR